jgi:hypothetical protein
MTEVSIRRLYVMRAAYLLMFVGLAFMAWPALVDSNSPPAPLPGVAFSFWAALSLLMALGIRYPLRMLPMLLIQLLYKLIWLLAIALPRVGGAPMDATMAEFTRAMVMGIIVDVVAIPWRYVLANYVRKPADGWSLRR